MKRVLRSLAAFVIVFGLLGTLLCLLLPEVFYKHLYMGSRIKGNVTVAFDGEKVPVEECLLGMLYPQNVRINGDTIKVKAHEGGIYSFTALNDGTELRFYIDKPDGRECVSFDMDFDVDTAAGVIHYTGKYRYFSDGLLRAEDVPVFGDYSLDYEHHSIGVYVNKVQ